ncbi:hypothetical protein EJB05_00720 [Eragrostis curvula]|uniref:NB-ARC domain-containing protein n=1 Tax=Eragrostis curvula TaxID=38414 RepID=A0A5J9WL25_9POAL|nr:hypothetical protein EJB05_00720 [Eragrostis curvula]
MDLVTGPIGSLAPKLLQLLRKEYKLQTEVKKQVKSLSVELESIYAALRKVAEVPWDQLDEQVKLWAREVRESSYDMEDLLDTFLVRVDSDKPADPSRLRHAIKKMGDLFSRGRTRRDIASAIEDIKKQLQEVAERRARYKIDEIVAKPVTAASTIDPRLAAMYKQVTQLIGIEDSRDKLMSILTSSQGDDVSSNKITKMVSVVGVGGLGKTTLAKVVYDKLKGDFTVGAFVPVGRNPDLKVVFRNILIDLDKKHYMESLNITILDERQLIDEIRELLKNESTNRYFVVIDDLWEPRSWETIKLALVENNCGSRVITTTRNLEIAKDVGEFYRLQPLSYDESRKLLYARILSGGKEHSLFGTQLDDYDEFVDKILNKCDGIPLAIITMASLLVDKPREEWPEMYTAIGFGNKDNRHVANTMRILSFSYYDLPSHLRTCLLYLSAFPEDYVIDKDSLIWMWIAEGFVHKKQGKGLFELGEGYFNELLNRSMIQAVDSQFYCHVDGCRVHDMVLDLIRSLSHEVNFVVTLDGVEGTSSQNRVRRVAQNGTTFDILTFKANYMDMEHVRSYIVCRCDSQWIPLQNFKLLRVLFLDSNEDVCGHLHNLGHLYHLRYLGLRGRDIRELPKQIQHLKFLQTLDVTESRIQELPACVIQLTNLMYLRSDSWFTSVPDGIGKLTFLEVLQVRVGRDDMSKRRFVKELGSLRELRVLETTIAFIDEGMEKDFVESLRKLYKIQHLSLLPDSPIINADVATWEASGFVLPQHLRHLRLHNIQFSRLPSCINLLHLHNLTFLGLLVATMDEQDMALLGTLPELLFLSLKMLSTVTISNINATDGYFLKLRFLEMSASMVQFQCNKEDLTVSFHTWNGIDVAPFGSREYDCSCARSVVMPNLQVLRMPIFVRALKDGNIDCRNIIGLEYLGLLQDGFLWIDCEGASTADVQEAEAALWNAIDVHPNRPTFQLPRWNHQELEDDKEYEEEGKRRAIMRMRRRGW